MANSRNNIYPVQLQGAELNLNKYDAEIKQYSGFNKNNSPFVGGCLSNLFTKNEACSNNIFIAPNGDKFEIKTVDTVTGLYKNDVLILPITSSSLTLEKIDFEGIPNEDVLYYKRQSNNNGYFLIYRDGAFNSFKLKVKKGSNVFTYDFTLTINGCNNYLDVKFFIYEHTISGNVFIAANIWGNNYSNIISSSSYNIYAGYNFFILNTSNVFTQKCNSADEGYYARNYENVHYPPFIGKSANDTNWLLYAPNLTYDNACVYKFYSSDFDSATTQTEITESGYRTIYVKDYFFCYHQSFFEKNEDSECMCIELKEVEKEYEYDPDITNVKVFSRSGIDLQISGTPKVILTQNNQIWCLINALQDKPATLKSHIHTAFINGLLGTYYVNDNFDVLAVRYQVTGMCDFTTGAVTKVDNDYIFNSGAVIGENILLNNGQISGIKIGETLITEWNSVKDVCEKYWIDYNNNWYTINYSAASDTKISYLFDKYLVLNISDKNLINYETGEISYYAPAWNNRFPFIPSYSGIFIPENTGYIASSINEYNLKQGASILLNPIESVRIPVFNETQLAMMQSNRDIYTINFYCGEIVNNVRYKCSFEYPNYNKIFIKENLYGLPFPIDTNGNVVYSPSLFSKYIKSFVNEIFIMNGNNGYPLIKEGNNITLNYYLASVVEDIQQMFIIQGQAYGIIKNYIFSLSFYNGVTENPQCIISVEGLQFVGSTPYEVLFFSKTNRCLYSFNGSNVLNQKQFVDKISVIKDYKYNSATGSLFLITDIGVLCASYFGTFLIETTGIADEVFLLDDGLTIRNNDSLLYLKYYLNEDDEDYTKQNIELDTCFYGMNNQTVTINDCLYFRIFSEDHAEGDLTVSATTLSLEGRKTENTTFKIKSSDWDAITHTIYLRYQPKEQRGLGVSFSIDSPFKIASLSVGSQADAILVDKVSKGAYNAPSVTSDNDEW